MATSFLFRNNWFGKAVFTCGAFAVAPLDPTSTAIWTAVGFGLGYQFDQFAAHDHLTLKQSANAWRLLRQTKHHNPWMIFTFAALGEMARIQSAGAGKSNAAHRSHALRLMQDLRFDPEAKERARGWYQAGMEDGCPLPELAARCRRFGHFEFESFAVQSLTSASQIGDNAVVQVQCQLALRGLGALLGLEDTPTKAEPETGQGSDEASEQSEQYSAKTVSVADAQRLLGVSKTASKDDVKKAYRKLASDHHPDRLPQGANSDERKRAQSAMAAINSAKEILDATL